MTCWGLVKFSKAVADNENGPFGKSHISWPHRVEFYKFCLKYEMLIILVISETVATQNQYYASWEGCDNFRWNVFSETRNCMPRRGIQNKISWIQYPPPPPGHTRLDFKPPLWWLIGFSNGEDVLVTVNCKNLQSRLQSYSCFWNVYSQDFKVTLP